MTARKQQTMVHTAQMVIRKQAFESNYNNNKKTSNGIFAMISYNVIL